MSGYHEEKKCGSVQDVIIQDGMLNVSRKRSHRVYYVYVWLDPRKPGKFICGEYVFDHEPFYVGKGHKYRMNFQKRNALVNNKLRKFSEPICLMLKEKITEHEAFEEEMKVITNIGRLNLGEGSLCNLTNGGEGSSGCSPSEITRQKLSAALSNKPKTKEHALKIKEGKTGKPSPLKGCPGRTWTEESRKKLGLSMKGKVPWMKGKHHTKATKRKLSIAGKKRVLTEIVLLNIRNAAKNRVLTENTRKKLREAAKNRPPVTEKTKRKLRKAAKNRPPVSEETRRRQRESAKHRPPISEETRRKERESAKRAWNKRKGID